MKKQKLFSFLILFAMMLVNLGLGNISNAVAQDAPTETPEQEVTVTPPEIPLQDIPATPTPMPDEFDSIPPTPTDDASGQIIGGAPADPGEWPWQVALVDSSASNLWYGQFCGGSLVHPSWVVTAAHCVYGEDPWSVDVVAGVYNLWNPTPGYQRRYVSQIIIHPSYNPSTSDADIALLRLSTPVTIGGSGATKTALVPIVSSTVGSLAGLYSWVTGWGNTNTQQYPVYPHQLYEVQLPIYSNEACNDPIRYNGRITNNMLCAGFDAGGKDSCQGDSGGPLVVWLNNQWQLAGVVSWGDGCALPYRPGVYTRVSNFSNWIHNYVPFPDVYEPDNAPAQAKWLYSESPQTHSITPVGDQDWVNFTLSATSAVLLETKGLLGDTEMALYDSSLNLIEYNDDGGKDFFSRIDRVCNIDALPAGTYYVKINEYGNNHEIASYTLSFISRPCPAASIDVMMAGNWQGSYLLASGEERREYYNVSGGPVTVQSLGELPIVSAIRLQSFANNTLHSFVETMGVPQGLLSHKYVFPTYNNTWAPLNSQIRFGNLSATTTRIRVTVGGVNVWEQDVPGLEERRLTFPVSGGPVIIESLDTSKKIVAAIRLQSFANNTLHSFSETMGIPNEYVSHKYYFPTYNNTWAPLNSQVRFGNLSATTTRIRVTIGGTVVWEDDVPGLEERRLTFPVSGGPVVVESLDSSKKIVAAIRLQSYANNTLHSFVETMGVPDGLLSHKYYFPTYNNTWGPLNSQVRFGNLSATTTRIRVTIGGVNVWEQDVPGLEERRLYFPVSGGPVIIESLDSSKKIVAAIRLQSFANNILYSFSETMGIPAAFLSNIYYFPTYNNTWPPLNSQLRFGVP